MHYLNKKIIQLIWKDNKFGVCFDINPSDNILMLSFDKLHPIINNNNNTTNI